MIKAKKALEHFAVLFLLFGGLTLAAGAAFYAALYFIAWAWSAGLFGPSILCGLAMGIAGVHAVYFPTKSLKKGEAK